MAVAKLAREELSAEAIRLGRLLAELVPNEPEVMGLHALMLLTESRRDARVAPGGALVLLNRDGAQYALYGLNRSR